MTATEMVDTFVGRIAMYSPGATSPLAFRVRVVDARKAYGNVQFQVAPESGVGTSWVSDVSVKFIDEMTR